MGLALSCPGGDALDERLEALIMRSLSGANVKSTLKSFSFNGRGAEPAIVKAFGSGKWVIEGSLSYRKEDRDDPFQLETKISITSPKGNPVKATIRTSRFGQAKEKALESPKDCPKHNAAVKLQKVYKSFRTRRQLADCAVLVEQRWWKLLDFALLKQSSVSFFDIEEPESVVSRWMRARRRAATVGKGLSKDEKAQKLALQHWLEAIDPRHRYGHNLHFYYDCWLHCESNQPFFYWLDLGEGKEVNLDDQCPRSKLQHQCIKYLGPKEREAYEVILEDAKFMYRTNRKLIDTSEGPENSKWIFVLSTTKTLYVGQKRKGTFQHSSFLAGGATSAAGRLVVSHGILKAVWPHSGHYRPTKQNFLEFVNFLKENNVDLTDVQLSPTQEDEEMPELKNIHSQLDLTGTDISAEPEDNTSIESSNGDNITSTEFKEKAEKSSFELHEEITPKVQEERVDEAYRNTKCFKSKRAHSGNLADIQSVRCKCVPSSPMSEGHYKHNLFREEQEEDEGSPVTQEAILRRINSKKGMESYQLGKQLSFKWTTGAGPRIAYVRDYPSELQVRSLEQVHLSPRVDRPHPSPRIPSLPSPRIPPCTPRIPESAFSRKVPMLQKPKMRR